ncbi:MAG: outer membrane beta-barrel protein, partial [Chitinophagaceae bacterium]
ILSIIFLLAFSLNARAQDEGGGFNHTKVSIGIKAGVNLSRLDGISWDGGFKANLLGGAWLSVHGKRFGIVLEGLFTQTDYVTGPGFDSIYHQYIRAGKDSIKNASFKLNYFNIPLLVEIRVLDRAWLQFGPQYSGVVSVEDKDEFVKDAEGLFKKGSIAGVAGLNVELTRHINLGARYIFGLSNVNNHYDQVAESWKRRDVQIHLGLRF